MCGLLPRFAVGLGAPQAINACHHGHYEGLIRCLLVGSCVLPGENVCTYYMTTFARLTQSRAISQSIVITFRPMRETKRFHFFHFSKLFLYKITVSFTMVIKRSPGGESAGNGRSTSKSTCADLRSGVISDCIWRSTSIRYVQT